MTFKKENIPRELKSWYYTFYAKPVIFKIVNFNSLTGNVSQRNLLHYVNNKKNNYIQ